ncbi:PAS domain S-box-containing protein [Noviherbaspirillum humi]|uniref:PAS domain S-box-containing protein n=1 Tax=Noviherbaspirillum humi TaxID=1688639 RepID=A0A239DQD1_9BURK|nr:PAS domain S-box protein [Noviherbaspirillum humi]SNS33804.1 PAS domain S-box-containing protein [Noviherbaspirillum humi]
MDKSSFKTSLLRRDMNARAALSTVLLCAGVLAAAWVAALAALMWQDSLFRDAVAWREADFLARHAGQRLTLLQQRIERRKDELLRVLEQGEDETRALLATRLADMADTAGIPVHIALFEHDGETVIDNGAPALTSNQRAWVLSTLRDGQGSSSIVMHGKSGELLSLLTLHRASDKKPLGALAYRLALNDLLPIDQSARLVWNGQIRNDRGDRSGPPAASVPVPLPAQFQPLGLRVELSGRSQELDTGILLPAAGLLAVLLLLVAAAWPLARRLQTRVGADLQRLVDQASALNSEGGTRLSGGASAQTSELARVINLLLDVLDDRKQQPSHDYDARYRQLFEEARVVMLLVDPIDSRLVDANPAAVAFYGYSRELMVGMHMSEINVMSDLEIAEEVRAADRERRKHFNFRHRLANGEVRPVQVHSGSVEVGGRSLLFSVVHDIGPRWREPDLIQQDKIRRALQSLADA